MRKAITALGIFGGSLLYAVIWLRIFYFSYNYRSAESDYVVILFPFIFIVSFSLGLYINALIFWFFSRRERDIVPSALLERSVIAYITAMGGYVQDISFEY